MTLAADNYDEKISSLSLSLYLSISLFLPRGDDNASEKFFAAFRSATRAERPGGVESLLRSREERMPN